MLTNVEDREDVRVIERRRGARFLLQSFEAIGDGNPGGSTLTATKACRSWEGIFIRLIESARPYNPRWTL